MRSISKILLSAVVLLSGMFSLQNAANAAITPINGSICKPYGNSNTAGLYSYVNGVYNGTGSYMSVVCPLTRSTASGVIANVWVDGVAPAGTSTYCAVYSYNYNGTYLGSVSFSGATGTFTRSLALPAAQVGYYSSQSVYCSLPPGGRIYDVEPY